MPESSTTPQPAPAWALALEAGLSRERLNKYRTFVPGGGLGPALQLYHWNVLASAAFFEVLGYVEVVLRNALDDQLQARHLNRHGSGDWWDDPEGALEDTVLDDIDGARSRVTRTPITHGRVLAELNFGTWRYLLAARYEHSLWTPALRLAFPNLKPARRDDIYTPVERINSLRNRIAHHEPIHAFALDARHEDALFILTCINTDLGTRVRQLSRWSQVKSVKP